MKKSNLGKSHCYFAFDLVLFCPFLAHCAKYIVQTCTCGLEWDQEIQLRFFSYLKIFETYVWFYQFGNFSFLKYQNSNSKNKLR